MKKSKMNKKGEVSLESLSFENFIKLTDEQIRKLNPSLLLKHARETGDQRNFMLRQIISNYPSDSSQIANQKFDKAYQKLRKDSKQIFQKYGEIVGKFAPPRN